MKKKQNLYEEAIELAESKSDTNRLIHIIDFLFAVSDILPHNIGKFSDIKELVVSFYNARSDIELKIFLIKVKGNDINSDNIENIQSDSLGWLYDEQAIFRSILDSILDQNIPNFLNPEQLKKINDYLCPPYQIWIKDGNRILTQMPISQMYPWLTEACKLLVRMFNRLEVLPEKCAFAGCNNIYIPHPGGLKQKFCSSKCRTKEHRLQKNIPL